MTRLPLETLRRVAFAFFFFNDTATTEIYTLSLHDALPIFGKDLARQHGVVDPLARERIDQPRRVPRQGPAVSLQRSEEHTSELQSLAYLVCRLLLEKKKAYPRPCMVHCATYRTKRSADILS